MKAKVIKTTAEAVTKVPEVKAAVAETAASDKTAEVKEEANADVKPAKGAKKTTTKKAAATKATTAKTTAAKSAVKKEVKASITVQFEGKSYSQEELMKIAKDVWKFDLKKKVGDLKSVELYVKPEENTCYYVMNNEIAGSFSL
ncbi:MAG: hypothetical protein IJP31_02875 [Lachnospiraceae bacterium]|nr:hypothetical protein [Lachnospiraceae bacterium]